jgi:hypothetical protein
MGRDWNNLPDGVSDVDPPPFRSRRKRTIKWRDEDERWELRRALRELAERESETKEEDPPCPST